MTKDEALRLALAKFEAMNHKDSIFAGEYKFQITAIKTALEAKDEPWEQFCDSHCVWTDHHPDCKLAKDEPVAWMRTSGTGSPVVTEALLARMPEMRWIFQQPLYTTPPQRTWVGLTDEEKHLFSSWLDDKTDDEVFTAIEAKLKEKNTWPT
jgi:hypothetical protein